MRLQAHKICLGILHMRQQKYFETKRRKRIMEKLRLDIVSDNLDQYFQKACKQMGPEEKSNIPDPIISRLFMSRGRISQKSLTRIGFLGKMFVLFKAQRKRVFVFVEGSPAENAMTITDFLNYRKSLKEKDFSEVMAGQMLTHAHFVLGGKDLMDSMGYLNDLSTGPAYNFLTRLKNGKKDSMSDWIRQREYVIKFLLTYESNKKKWLRDYDMSMSEFLSLMYMYNGREVTGSEMYNTALTNAHFSSGSRMREGLSSLKNRNYITKQGVSKGTLYRITPLGKHVIDEIVNKYALKS
jgi:DNA-binding MarR family transcriptional regulator